MNAIDKVIFNALATRQGVVLPEVGTLKVVRKSAVLQDARHLNAPVTRVEFSSKQDDNITSILAFIATEADTDAQTARTLYDKWLVQVRHDNVVTIDGVGEIKSNFFKPSKELNALLNPFGDSKIVFTPRRDFKRLAMIILPAAAAFAGVVYLMVAQPAWLGGMLSGDNIEIAVEPAAVVVPAMDVQTVESTPVDSAKATQTVQPAITASVAPAPASTAPVASTSSTSAAQSNDTTYHVIFGVFSTSANAEKCINDIRRKDSSLPLMKVPYKGGKILVSVYSARSEAVADQHKKRLSAMNPDLWIYKQVIK